MHETHGACDQYGDVATASLIEVWIDEAEAPLVPIRGRPGRREAWAVIAHRKA